jgi:Transposase DNA-binding/Transposase Tn5 dimerisation domain
LQVGVHQEPQRWAEEQFAGAKLTDIRRVARVKTIAEAMAVHPGRSIPQLCDSPYAVKATYNLFNHEEATPENLQAGHRAAVLEAMRQPGVYLLLEDTTELSWSGKHAIRGLGPIGNSAAGLQGFFLHTVLSVRWPDASQDTSKRRPVEVLGIGDQQYYVRTPCRRPRESSQERLRRARESQVWPQASQHLGHAPHDVQWIRVADREADIYEYLVSCQALGHGFVIRAAKDRALSHPETGKRAGRLFTAARSAVPLGEFTLELRQRPKHPARTAHLCVSATAVALSAPWRPGYGRSRKSPITCTAVRVWEVTAPDAEDRLEWILLCDADVADFAQARACVLQYATRWVIEEYHKAIKTGLGAERLQLESVERLFAAIAIMSVVALRLIELRERLRKQPDAEATQSGLSPLELEVLRQKSGRTLRTVREVALAIGRLGGHLNRKGDGLPGWQTLWHGMNTLHALVEGVLIAHRLKSFG